MDILEFFVFFIGIPFCVFGNLIAYIIVVNKGLSPRLSLSGTPFYMYKLCRESPEKAGKVATYLALSSSIAFCIVFPLSILIIQSWSETPV
jgi:hypothetical protein